MFDGIFTSKISESQELLNVPELSIQKPLQYKVDDFVIDYRKLNVSNPETVPFDGMKIFSTNETLYSLVIPTYKRPNALKIALKHYCTFKNIKVIVVAWFNEERPDKEEFIDFTNFSKNKNCTAEEVWFYHLPNLIRFRYYPFPKLTTKAVFNVDDDIIIKESSFHHAFDIWKV